MITLRYNRVDLKNHFDIFRKKLIDCAIKGTNNSEYIMMLMQDLKYPKYLFDFNNNPRELTAEEAKSEVNKAILTAIDGYYPFSITLVFW